MAVNSRKVLFWGLQGSGKTSFLLALLKAIYRYGNDLGCAIDVNYINESTGDIFRKTLAQFLEHDKFPLHTNSYSSLDLNYRYYVSRKSEWFSHNLRLIDVPGYEIHNDGEYYSELLDSSGLICLLEPSRESNNYTESLKTLKRFLAEQRFPTDYFVALVLGKTDIYFEYEKIQELSELPQKNQQRKNRDLIADVIGEDTIFSIEQALHGRKIRYFLSSAAGWTKAKHDGHFPNILSPSGQLQPIIYCSEYWRPWDVLEVFFWLLDSMDLSVLDPTLEAIRYEQIIKLFWRWLILEDKEQDFNEWLTT